MSQKHFKGDKVATTMQLMFVTVLGLLSTVFTITDSAEQVHSKFSTKCTTPNNEVGVCLEIRKCSVFIEALMAGKNESFDFIRESRCGPANEDPRQAKVCCGTHDSYLRKTTTIKPSTTSERNPLPSNCGVQYDDSDRVFGGTEASFGEFPWMARLRHRRRDGSLSYGCSGFLISEKFVITAAHCMRSKALAPLGPVYQVQLGEHNTEVDEDCDHTEGTVVPMCADPRQLLETGEPIVHPEYSGEYQHHNDIAIVPLKEPAKFTEFVFPICLSNTVSQETIFWVSGWGKTETRIASPAKLKTHLPRVNKVQCTSMYRPVGIAILDSQLCAGGEAGRDSCSGDSGGPLMVSRDSVWHAEGIVSFGKGCGEKGWPGIYTSVPYHMPWIEREMNRYMKGEEAVHDNVSGKNVGEEYVTWSW